MFVYLLYRLLNNIDGIFLKIAIALLFLALPLLGKPPPEAASGRHFAPVVSAEKCLVVSAHTCASEAGFAMLQKGGSAADALVAVQLVLTLVEPQSSGIGGGAFLLYYDHKTQSVRALDGRETAPLHARLSPFIEEKPIPYLEALLGGRSVGVPGVLHLTF